MKNELKNLMNEQLVTSEMLELVESLGREWKEGRYELANGAYANAESYYTKATSVFERHNKFIDIQIVLQGMEVIELITPTVKQEYDETRDIEFVDIPDVDRLYMEAGTYCIITPATYHKPCMDCCGRHHIKKVVIKVPVKHE